MDNISAPENIVTEEKVLKKSPLLKILLILVFLAVLGVLGFLFKDNILNLFFPKDIDIESVSTSQVEPSQDNPFGEFIGDEVDEEVWETDFSGLDEKFKEEDEISNLINATGQFVDWSQDWNWETSWVLGTILSISEDTMNIRFDMPDSMSGVEKEVTYLCDEDKSMLMSKSNLIILDAGINVYEKTESEYFVYSHCLDEECTKIGNGCVIVKMF